MWLYNTTMIYDTKLVMVEWIDSARPNPEWQFLGDYKPVHPISCISVGFLICDSDEVKAIAPNMGDTKNKNIQASGIIHIPTCSVLKITELKEV